VFLKKIRAFAQLIGFLTITLLAAYGALSFFQNADSATAAPEVQESGNGELSIAAIAATNDFVPGYITYQGILKDKDGMPLTGAYTMDFRVYDSATGSVEDSRLWWSKHENIVVDNGYFSVLLGTSEETRDWVVANGAVTTGVSPAVFNGQERYIGVTVSGANGGIDTEMVPRQRFSAVPYAYRADNASSLASDSGRTVLTASENLTVKFRIGHNRAKLNLWPVDDTDTTAHGIGTESWHNIYGPTADAENGYVGHRFYARGNEAAAQIGVGNLIDDAVGALDSHFFGKVGIGVNPADQAAKTLTRPERSLHVVGNALVDFPTQCCAWLFLRSNDGASEAALTTWRNETRLEDRMEHDIVLATGARVDDVIPRRVTIKSDTGNVGIGYTSPTETLHVAGNAKIDGTISGESYTDRTGGIPLIRIYRYEDVAFTRAVPGGDTWEFDANIGVNEDNTCVASGWNAEVDINEGSPTTNAFWTYLKDNKWRVRFSMSSRGVTGSNVSLQVTCYREEIAQLVTNNAEYNEYK